MRCGTLRDLVTLMEPLPTNDPRFGLQAGWVQFGQAWANVTPTGGTETVENQGVQTEATHTIIMRYRSDVTSIDRIVYRGQTLEILNVIDPTGKRRELLIQAKLYVGVA